MSNPNSTGDGSRGRYDPRKRHDGMDGRELNGAPITLTAEEIAAMDPQAPTSRTIVVTPLPALETIERSLEKVQEAVQTTLAVIHRRATKELQLLDDKELQCLSTIATTLIRIKKLSDEDVDPSTMSEAQLTKAAK